LLARKINTYLGTTLGPWEIDQLDDTFISIIDLLLKHYQPPPKLPTHPAIAQARQLIKTAYYRRLGQ